MKLRVTYEIHNNMDKLSIQKGLVEIAAEIALSPIFIGCTDIRRSEDRKIIAEVEWLGGRRK